MEKLSIFFLELITVSSVGALPSAEMSILLRSKLNFAKELIFYPAFIRLFTCSYYSADLRDFFQ